MRRHLARFVASAVVNTQISLLLMAMIFTFWPGAEAYTVRGGSMEPALSIGDLVAVADLADQEVKPGDLMLYKSQGLHVTHRVIALADDGSFITKGDANAEIDTSPVLPEDVVGKVRMVVPMVGRPRMWYLSGKWVAIGIWTVVTTVGAAVLWFPRFRP